MEERRFVLRSEFVRRNALAFVEKIPIDWEVLVRPFVERRTTTANARLWALHALAAAHTGYSAEEMHEHALCKHFGYTERKVIDPFTGEILVKRIPNERSSVQNRKKFGEFMEATEVWYIQEFGVVLDDQRAA